jgi:molybdopterin-guanine dinucleotide biosynthesis adapter protein
MSKRGVPMRIHVVGRKNSGKTTLVCELVRELTVRGLKVATVKHTHHRHELDTPGKDSYLHRDAGAVGVGILSPQMTAMFVPWAREEHGDNRYELFERQFSDCDLILVEGDLQTSAPRVEVWRAATSDEPYAVGTVGIRAVITDDEFLSDDGCAVWARSNVAAIADRLLQLAAAE